MHTLHRIFGKVRHHLTPGRRYREELELLTSYSTETMYRWALEDERFSYVSPAVMRLLGYSSDAMRQLDVRDLIVDTRSISDGMKSVEAFDDLLSRRRGGDAGKWEAEYLMKTKDGTRRWINDISYPWFDAQGNIIGAVGCLRDIDSRVRMEEEVKDQIAMLSNTDPLTGLANRRAFFEMLERELMLIQRSGNDASMLLVDIDHFSRINAIYGREVGDYMLVEISKIVLSCLRETDYAARLDGEEFGIILPDTPSDGAYWVAERIRSAVVKHVFAVGSDREPIGCSVCVGAASAVHGITLDAASFYKQADTRLYISKNTGRNQVAMDNMQMLH
ncbi:MAG: sensor domain-containing diguanylate cyclase [Hyphomicrobiales bacterium]|nr:sensor domain-containing diguanylate cyclase [Rickettsiales bacterium]MCP5362316.1 sensor domain-containing diguanylate cyclase [Hyphomicrobiales bacterium]